MVSLSDMAQQAYAQSQAAQANDNAQLSSATNDYNTANTNANNAQNELQNFTGNMQSGTDMYAKQLQAANQNAGYDVNNLNQAQNQVSQLTGILGGLPRAVQAVNANYGATAGNVANQYATEGANLNQSLQLANQNAQNQLAKQQAGLTGAQAATTAGLQGQQNSLTGYQAAATNAVNLLDQARQNMNGWATIAQQQGYLTAQQQQSYQTSVQLAAAAQQALAQAGLLASQTSAQNLQNQMTQTGINNANNALTTQGMKDKSQQSIQAERAANNAKGYGYLTNAQIQANQAAAKANQLTPIESLVNWFMT